MSKICFSLHILLSFKSNTGTVRDNQQERERSARETCLFTLFHPIITLSEYFSCLCSKANFSHPHRKLLHGDSSTVTKCQSFHITWKKFQEVFLKETHWVMIIRVVDLLELLPHSMVVNSLPSKTLSAQLHVLHSTYCYTKCHK